MLALSSQSSEQLLVFALVGFVNDLAGQRLDLLAQIHPVTSRRLNDALCQRFVVQGVSEC